MFQAVGTSCCCSASSSRVIDCNFGQRPFAYAAPSGFKSLNTANLPTPTILAGNTAFDTKLYTGNGSTQTISGLAFSPDFVWIKARSGATSRIISLRCCSWRQLTFLVKSNKRRGI
jgi:hypothetical protein